MDKPKRYFLRRDPLLGTAVGATGVLASQYALDTTFSDTARVPVTNETYTDSF